MLIILPPSEAKREAPPDGPTLDFERLSFPELNPTRRRLLRALAETSSAADAFERLQVGPALVHEVLRNTDLAHVPTRAAWDVYAGPLYDGLAPGTLSARARRRADHELVICSALWGLLRPNDHIPAYRMHVCARLVEVDRIEPVWRAELPALLAQLATDSGVVVDMRSPSYKAVGKPIGLGERMVELKVGPGASVGGVGDVIAKRVRGQVAHALLESKAVPHDAEMLSVILGEHWSVRLEEPSRPGKPWTLHVRVEG